MCMKNENDLLQAVVNEVSDSDLATLLKRFSSEQLLREVNNRNDIYINGWWNSEHILDNTGLPTQYHTAFIKYCNENAICEELETAIEQWLESIKEELHTYLISNWFFDIMAFGGCAEINSDSPEKYRDFLSQALDICYEPADGIYPLINFDRFFDVLEEKSNELYGTKHEYRIYSNEETQSIIFDLITVFKPHHGNLKTHLEEKMQELINEYLFLDK